MSLSGADGAHLSLCFIARDAVGQESVQQVAIYVDGSSTLSPVATVNGEIWDVTTDRIMFLDKSSGQNTLTIQDRGTGQETPISPTGQTPLSGYLTASGAVFISRSSGATTGTIYEWTNGRMVIWSTLDRQPI